MSDFDHDPTAPIATPPTQPWNAGAAAWTEPYHVGPGDEGDGGGGERRGVSRRRFLAGAAGVGVAGAAALALTHHSWSHLLSSPTPASSPASRGKGILVMVTLYGGNDGLNTIIPFQDSAYLQARPTLGYQPDQVLLLADGLGLHPNLKGLKALWEAKQLAIVRGVGYPDPVLSHFRGMAIWQTASPDGTQSSGVFGRWLDATGSDPMRSISIGSTLPVLLTGDKSAATAIEGTSIRLPGGAALAPILASFDAPGPDREGLAGLVARSGSDLLSVQHQLGDLLGGSTASGASASGAAGGTGAARASGAAGAAAGRGGGGKAAGGSAITSLAGQLDIVAQLIKAGSPTKVYQVSMGGFDNHAAEKDTHAALMTDLDDAISGFMTSIKGSPAAEGVVLATYSEFGRRVAQNASGGTDHGTAAPLFVAGPGVKGGQFYGEEPPLTGLDDGNLNFTTDFRSVFATLLADVVGVDPKVALNGSFPTLNLV
jgi:uncharacterized protein (DUF1501 family)